MSLSDEAIKRLQKAKDVGWDLKLDSVIQLLALLDNPQDKIPVVHITGTNGKGSTLAFLNSICMEAGLKVGRFTSPAVATELERYTINDEFISQESYDDLLDTVTLVCDAVESKGFRYPSVFEIETALACLYFSKASCDLMLFEVGMGGVLDATNVFSNPLVCAFASIGLDHTQWLGDGIEDITRNKAGIIKPGCHIVSALQQPASTAILEDTAKSKACDITFCQPLDNNNKLSLEGAFQKQNAAIARQCALILRTKGFDISDKHILEGLKKARWPYRFEEISSSPRVILDGAHNMPAVLQLKQSLKDYYADCSKTFIISVLKDKDYEPMFKEILPMACKIILLESSNPRALKLDALYNTVCRIVDDSSVCKSYSADQAIEEAMNTNNELTVCFGTFTFLADMRLALKNSRRIIRND